MNEDTLIAVASDRDDEITLVEELAEEHGRRVAVCRHPGDLFRYLRLDGAERASGEPPCPIEMAVISQSFDGGRGLALISCVSWAAPSAALCAIVDEPRFVARAERVGAHEILVRPFAAASLESRLTARWRRFSGFHGVFPAAASTGTEGELQRVVTRLRKRVLR